MRGRLGICSEDSGMAVSLQAERMHVLSALHAVQKFVQRLDRPHLNVLGQLIARGMYGWVSAFWWAGKDARQ